MSSNHRATIRTSLFLAVLACGVGGTTGVAAAPAAPPTKAEARAVARAVNLVAADLPGFTGSRAHSTPAARRFAAMLTRCAGGTLPGEALVNLDSPDFARMSAGSFVQQDVSSNVTVVRSPRLAAQDLAAVRSTRGKGCLAKAVGQLLRGIAAPGVRFGRIVVSSASQPAPGASGSYALRVKVTADASGVRIPFYIDGRGFTLGRAEVALTALGILQPFPAADEQRLFSLLLERAIAHRI
jgi:hypothetical protein